MMIPTDPYLIPGLHADIQTTHLVRRTALQLADAASSQPTVYLDRLTNERVANLVDGRRISIRFLQRAPRDRRPSRREVRVISSALQGIPARLVNIRSVGAGTQADLAYEIGHPENLRRFIMPDHLATAGIVPLYTTLGMAMAALGMAAVRHRPVPRDGVARSHLRLLRVLERDAQTARMGIWAAPMPSSDDIRSLF